MKFATLNDGTLDGRLVLVSRDGARAVATTGIVPTLIDALRHWATVRAWRPT